VHVVGYGRLDEGYVAMEVGGVEQLVELGSVVTQRRRGCKPADAKTANANVRQFMGASCPLISLTNP